MKYRFVLAFLALLVVGSFAAAQAQVSSNSPYILEIGNAKVAAGNDRVRINHTAPPSSYWHQIYAVPTGANPTRYSVRQLTDQVAVIHIPGPAPAGGITFDFQVIVWEP